VINLVVKTFVYGSDHHGLETSAATLEASESIKLKNSPSYSAFTENWENSPTYVSGYYNLWDADLDFKSIFSTFSHISRHAHHLFVI